MLMKRRDSLRDAESLREQNDELRGLLKQYLSSSVNNELVVPPGGVPLASGRRASVDDVVIIYLRYLQ